MIEKTVKMHKKIRKYTVKNIENIKNIDAESFICYI